MPHHFCSSLRCALATLTEWIVYRLELGFYFPIASYFHGVWLIQFADLFGQPGITFWLTLINVLLVREVLRPGGWQSRRIAFVFALLLGIPAAYSAYGLNQSHATGKLLDVLLVQPNQAQGALLSLPPPPEPRSISASSTSSSGPKLPWER